jgi:ribosomal protein S18 acetylase RimI-like enzyme
VKKEYRRKRIGLELYSELEKALTEENPETEKIDCMFYNPCSIPWFIPDHYPHDHPGVPGVYMHNEGYNFFKSLGFLDYAVQNAYYMPLGNYSEPCYIKERKDRLREQGIEVCLYDGEKHYGFSELFDNIKNEGWRKSVMSRLDEPIVVATKNNKVIGYTGPLSLSKEKRGLFCGIGVHTDFRSCGIGKVLFSDLCSGLQKMGGEYMSLFTGENNNARFVYESTGFQLVGKFSCMRKNIK